MISPVAKANELFGDRSQAGQDAYLYSLGAIASRLGELPELTTRDFGGLDPAYELSLIFRDASSPFIVLYWKMEPGAVLPAHCHPGANVCTLVTKGRTMIRNFDTVAGSPRCWESTDEEFDVIETKREVLLPGAVNTVSELRNNIHRFEAGPEGAEGIDITAGYDDKAKPFSFMAIANEHNRARRREQIPRTLGRQGNHARAVEIIAAGLRLSSLVASSLQPGITGIPA